MNELNNMNALDENEMALNMILISRFAVAAMEQNLLRDNTVPHRYMSSYDVEKGEREQESLVSYMSVFTEQDEKLCSGFVELVEDGRCLIALFNESTGTPEFVTGYESELDESEKEVLLTSIENNYENVMATVCRVAPSPTDEGPEPDLTSDEEELINALSPTQPI